MATPNRKPSTAALLCLLPWIAPACGTREPAVDAPKAEPASRVDRPSSHRVVMFSHAGSRAAGALARHGSRLRRAPGAAERAEQRALQSTPRRNEQHVAAKLQRLADVQRQLRDAGVLDTDDNGVGEPLFLAELLGHRRCRTGVDNVGTLLETFGLGGMFAGDMRDGITQADGYLLRMFVGDDTGAWHAEPDPREPLPFGDGDSTRSTTRWRCYAWPRLRGTTGHLVFCVDETGIVRASHNETTAYDGADRGPEARAAEGEMLEQLLHPADAFRGGDGAWWRQYDVPQTLPATPPK